MENWKYYLEAFINTAQYLAVMPTDTDIHAETAKVITNFFDVDFIMFAEKKSGKIECLCSGDYPALCKSIFNMTSDTVSQKFESGFLTSELIKTSEDNYYSIAFLPVTVKNQTTAVMLIGHKTQEVLPKELLNVYLAVSGLIGTAMEKKASFTALQESKRKLEDINDMLEMRIKEEVNKSREKDKVMFEQARHLAMGELLMNIAHQWRQPLNALGLIIQDIQDAKKFGELTDEYLANSVQKGMKQIQFMSKTIDDFRNFFRPDKERQTFDVKLAAGDVLSMLSAQLNSNNISYRLTCHEHNKTAEDFREIIPCDAFNIAGYPNEMKQVFMNIVNNSKDAILQRREEGLMPAGEKGRIALDFEREVDKVIIRISDNGGGIPEEIIDRIFDPYFTTKEQGRGTGIGLYMSKMIIEKSMNGKLTARNVDGGAEFRIELPTTSLPPRKFTNKSRD